MANEPPCWILDKHFKDTGKRNYSNCSKMCCTAICTEGRCKPFITHIENIITEMTEQKELFLDLLRDVDVQEAIKKILSFSDITDASRGI